MIKIVIFITVLVLAQACSGDFPGSRSEEQMASPRFKVAEYDFINNCYIFEWEPVYTASKYEIERACRGSFCYVYSYYPRTVTKETSDTTFTNCYNDGGDWSFDYTLGNSFSFIIQGYIDDAAGFGKMWGGAAIYSSPPISHIRLTSTDYNASSNCVNLRWNSIPRAEKYIVERTCTGTCSGVASIVTSSVRSTYYTNCYNDSGDLGFNYTQGDVLTYSIKAYARIFASNDPNGELSPWGGEVNYNTLPLY